MRFIDLFRMCFLNLFKRFRRTVMTVSGVVIGTSAIIVMVSLGIGLNLAFDEMIGNMADLTLINAYAQGMVNDKGEYEQKKITIDEIEYVKAIPHVKGATPMLYMYSDMVTIYFGDYRYYGSIYGIYLNEMENFGYNLTQGRYVTDQDTGKPVAFIGAETVYSFQDMEKGWTEQYDNMGNLLPPPFDIMKEDIFIAPTYSPEKKDDDEDKIDDTEEKEDFQIFLENEELVEKYAHRIDVLGQLETDERNYSTAYAIYMDIDFLLEMYDEYNELNKVKKPEPLTFSDLNIRVDDMDNTSEVETQIKNLGYDTWSAQQMRDQMKTFTMIIQLILGGLAGISLFVAAIGISNTMVMSITERTKEIGVMKVLGCNIGNIRTMFLMESGAIGMLGGIVGILVSYGISYFLNTSLSEMIMSNSPDLSGDMAMLLTSSSGISVIPVWLVAFALVFAIVIGLISGFQPANRAVKISPLEAIRHD